MNSYTIKEQKHVDQIKRIEDKSRYLQSKGKILMASSLICKGLDAIEQRADDMIKELDK